MDRPRLDVLQLAIEAFLRLAEAVEWSLPSPGEDIRITGETRLRVDDGERGLGQYHRADGILFARRFRYGPLVVVADVAPAHAANLFAPLRGQQRDANECAERIVPFLLAGCRWHFGLR